MSESVAYNEPELKLSANARAKMIEALRVTQALAKRLKENQLERYEPYPKQQEFHNDHATERLLSAANQVGKSYAGAYETAIHATGLYPEWWKGKRFNFPTRGWVAGESSETTRDGPQRLLLGEPSDEDQWGTAAIPKSRIVDVKRASGGSANAVDTLVVRHVSGGSSVIKFKAYNQRRSKFQSETLNYLWFDEEPPIEIYTEGLTRTNATRGIVYTTFTPLLGMSGVVRLFIGDADLESMLEQVK